MTPRDEEGREDPAQEPVLPMSEVFAGWVKANDAKPLPKLGYTPSAHTAAVASIVKALRLLPGWRRVRKRQVGRFILSDGNGNPRRKPGGGYLMINVAVAGDPDVECLWSPPGRTAGPLVIMVEAKTGSAVLSPDQREAKADLLAGGCIHIVASNGADAFEACLAAAKARAA